MENRVLTLSEQQIRETFNYNVEYIIEKQIPEEVLGWALQRENNYFEEDEIFVEYPEYAGYYCSNYGRLISTKGKKPKFIKSILLNRYYGYTLSKPNTKPLSITKGRMVADVFCPNPYKDKGRDYVDVHHIDHNKENNRWTNLVLIPNPLHDEVHRVDKKEGVKDSLEICIAPSKDGNLYPDSLKK